MSWHVVHAGPVEVAAIPKTHQKKVDKSNDEEYLNGAMWD
jgi:hypothetical protein